MGLFDNIVEKGKSAVEERNRIREKQKTEYGMKLNIKAGKKVITDSKHDIVTMWQQTDGSVYFDDNDSVLYEYLGYQWEGPKYKNVLTGNTSTVSKNIEKTKRSGRLVGAAIGTMMLPGIGTKIGAAIGTGTKTKGKTKEDSTTTSAEQEEEIPTLATILLKRLNNDKTIQIMVECTSEINNDLAMFVSSSEEDKSSQAINDDVYDKLKKLKDLLDMGILTQEEYNQKKNDLLGL